VLGCSPPQVCGHLPHHIACNTLAYVFASSGLPPHDRGQEEGTKDRPCAIVLTAIDDDGDTVVTVVPVTHSAPEHPDEAVELPPATKQRLGLDAERSWVVVNEINRFVWPGSDLRPVSRAEADRFDYGILPPAIFRQIKARLAACAKAQRLRGVNRTE
jgi:hypothetical protein